MKGESSKRAQVTGKVWFLRRNRVSNVLTNLKRAEYGRRGRVGVEKETDGGELRTICWHEKWGVVKET